MYFVSDNFIKNLTHNLNFDIICLLYDLQIGIFKKNTSIF
jgi:hypothetical protein